MSWKQVLFGFHISAEWGSSSFADLGQFCCLSWRMAGGWYATAVSPTASTSRFCGCVEGMCPQLGMQPRRRFSSGKVLGLEHDC